MKSNKIAFVIILAASMTYSGVQASFVPVAINAALRVGSLALNCLTVEQYLKNRKAIQASGAGDIIKSHDYSIPAFVAMSTLGIVSTRATIPLTATKILINGARGSSIQFMSNLPKSGGLITACIANRLSQKDKTEMQKLADFKSK